MAKDFWFSRIRVALPMQRPLGAAWWIKDPASKESWHRKDYLNRTKDFYLTQDFPLLHHLYIIRIRSIFYNYPQTLPQGGFCPHVVLIIYSMLIVYTSVCSSYSCKDLHLSLCLLFFLFISIFLFINCLLINTRWYIHFDLNIISTYLVLVPLLKNHRGLVYDCLFVR